MMRQNPNHAHLNLSQMCMPMFGFFTESVAEYSALRGYFRIATSHILVRTDSVDPLLTRRVTT